MNNGNPLTTEISNTLRVLQNFEFFKVGLQLISKQCIMGVHVEKSYDSDTGLPTCKFLVDFTGISEATGNTVNKKIPFFSFTSQSREDDITEETLILLMYCLIEAMDAEYSEAEGVVFNFDNVASRVGPFYEKAVKEMSEQNTSVINEKNKEKNTE